MNEPSLKQQVVAWAKAIGEKEARDRLVHRAGVSRGVAYLLVQGKYKNSMYLRTQAKIVEEMRKQR